MVMKMTKEYYLRPSDFDSNSNLSPQSVLEIFQDIAGEHAEVLGVGFDDLIRKNLIWVVVRTKYEVAGVLSKNQKVIAETWPLKSSGLVFRRDYLIKDQQGNILIRGASDWMLVNTESRKLETSKDIYPEGEDYFEDLAIPERIKKLRDYKGEVSKSSVVAKKSDIDANGHVNNTKYAAFVIGAINCCEKIKEFQIDYHKEVLKGQNINLFTGSQDGRAYAKGESDSGEKFFSCEILFD